MRSPGGVNALAVLLLLCPCASAAAAMQEQATVRFLAPQEGEAVAGPDLVVRLQAEGVILGGRGSDGAYALLALDGMPAVKSYSQRFTFRNVGEGAHRLEVELRRNDGAAFTPPVQASVSFTVRQRRGFPAGDRQEE